MRDLIADEIGGSSVFKDESKLGYDYVPEDLPGREDDMRTLVRAMKPILTTRSGQNVLITGPVGSGKTALSNRFVRDFKSVAQQSGVAIEFAVVNCRRRATESAALLRVLNHFDPRFPDRGFSNTEMLETLRKMLERKEAHLIVILDEADVLLKRSGSDLIYNLTRFNEEERAPKYSVSLLMVSQEDARRHLDEASRSTFKRTNVIELSKYDEDQLAKIVKQRVGLAFHPATFAEELEELAASIAAPYGDARYGIELLHKSGTLANDRNASEVNADDLRGAAADSHPFVTESRIRELDTHKRLTLLAIARAMKKGDAAFVITGDVEERYALACEEWDERPRAHTQFWTYLKELESLGFIRTRRSGKGVLGTTTLISLPDVPAVVLEEKLLEVFEQGRKN